MKEVVYPCFSRRDIYRAVILQLSLLMIGYNKMYVTYTKIYFFRKIAISFVTEWVKTAGNSKDILYSY
jgi:hypothetical protein